jgi:hypothetical protein
LRESRKASAAQRPFICFGIVFWRAGETPPRLTNSTVGGRMFQFDAQSAAVILTGKLRGIG